MTSVSCRETPELESGWWGWSVDHQEGVLRFTGADEDDGAKSDFHQKIIGYSRGLFSIRGGE
jgi:hypothetical protein